MNSGSRVVVVGGGVIGACCALYLRRAGCDVTLLDGAVFGRACSHGNCGYICPSHVLPLAEPGAAWNALRALFKKNSPFYIRPRLDGALLAWLLRFAGRCNTRDMLQAAEALAPLLALSKQEYEALQTGGIACEWENKGLLFVYSTAREFEHYAQTDRLLSERFHTSAGRWSRDELLSREPALRENVAGAWWYPGDAQLRPDVLMQSLRAELERSGVTIVEHCAVESFERAGHVSAAVQAGKRRFEAEAFVLATGAWSPRFQDELGVRLPIQPGKGYSLTYARAEQRPSRPMIFHERRVACTTFQSGFRLGSTMEFSGYDRSLNPRRLQILTDAAREYLRDPIPERSEEEWFGWRPMTYDSLPIIGAASKLKNVFIATGHSMLGLTLAPATGRLIADMVCGRTPAIDVAPYSAKRFD